MLLAKATTQKKTRVTAGTVMLLKLGMVLVTVFLVPLAIIGLVAILISIRPHAATMPCAKTQVREVTLLETKWFNLQYPWAQRCIVHYRTN